MDLRKAGIAEQCAAPVSPPDRRSVGALGVGRKVKNVPVSSRRQHNHVGGMALDRAGHQVARDDAARLAIDDHQVQHLAARVHLHAAGGLLLFERLVSAQQQLLPGLAARVERARNLHAAEGTRVEQSSVLARKRDALRHALVDDVDADLRQAIDVRFARAKVAALHRVIEEAKDAVAVVPVILRGVDAALRGDRVRAARAVVKRKTIHAIALLAERSSRGCSGESRSPR